MQLSCDDDLKAVFCFVAACCVSFGVGVLIGNTSSTKPNPYAIYRDIQLTDGMTIAELKATLGEPDHYWKLESTETLEYGAFGAYVQNLQKTGLPSGHRTKYRLSLTFTDGKLTDWEKTTPLNRE